MLLEELHIGLAFGLCCMLRHSAWLDWLMDRALPGRPMRVAFLASDGP